MPAQPPAGGTPSGSCVYTCAGVAAATNVLFTLWFWKFLSTPLGLRARRSAGSKEVPPPRLRCIREGIQAQNFQGDALGSTAVPAFGSE